MRYEGEGGTFPLVPLAPQRQPRLVDARLKGRRLETVSGAGTYSYWCAFGDVLSAPTSRGGANRKNVPLRLQCVARYTTDGDGAAAVAPTSSSSSSSSSAAAAAAGSRRGRVAWTTGLSQPFVLRVKLVGGSAKQHPIATQPAIDDLASADLLAGARRLLCW